MALWQDKQNWQIISQIQQKKGENKSIKLEMTKEKLQQTMQKYERSWDYYSQLYVSKMDPEEMDSSQKSTTYQDWIMKK